MSRWPAVPSPSSGSPSFLNLGATRFEYAPKHRFRYAGGVFTGRLTNLVEVLTDDDITGVGSADSHPGLVRTIVENHLRPAIVGADPLKPIDFGNSATA